MPLKEEDEEAVSIEEAKAPSKQELEEGEEPDLEEGEEPGEVPRVSQEQKQKGDEEERTETEAAKGEVLTPPPPLEVESAKDQAEESNKDKSTKAEEQKQEEEETRREIVVSNIPERISEEELKVLLQQFGEIESTKLLVDQHTGRSTGIAVVTFVAAAGAVATIAAMDGMQIDNRTLRVSFETGSKSSGSRHGLYVGNLEPGVTARDLEELFQAHGHATGCKVVTDRTTGRPKGFGFVFFGSIGEAEAAIASLDGAVLPSISTRGLSVRHHRPRDDASHRGVAADSPQAAAMASPYGSVLRFQAPHCADGAAEPPVVCLCPPEHQPPKYQGVCVFVYNLAQDADGVALRQLCKPFGTVVSANVKRGPDGRCKGFGFVNMATMDDAQRAISALNGSQFVGRHLQVRLKTEKTDP